MAKANRDRVSEALELLSRGLQLFVEREMKSVYAKNWKDEAEISLSGTIGAGKKIVWTDPQTILILMWEQWNNVFKNTLGHAERSLVSELREARNRWAHMENFSSDDTYRVLDSIDRLLTSVSAPEAEEVEKQKTELLRLKFDEQRRHEQRKAASAAVEGRPAENLKSWREIITPHPDVASGRYQQAEFAADLWQVYMREGSDEYKDPAEFFRRTFLTDGLKQLLKNALMRLSGKGGDPVVELQTNFGGGKTHSILALYHLFSGTPVSNLAGMEDLIRDTEIKKIPENVRRAVLVGTKISPGQIHKKPDGTDIKTLWGEMAWQLGGKEGYALVKEADESATNPGDNLRELFNQYSPCLILIDEWVAYARQLHDDNTLPAGTFDTQFTFTQTLTEAVKAAKNTLLVISIPASESPSPHDGKPKIEDIEIGGKRGKDALIRLKSAIGRVEASWRPATPEEGFEIVRRRLFQPITDPNLFTQRDLVARAFTDMYGAQHPEFPGECREAAYRERIKAAYPIHPELFDHLYNDWSTLAKFQRTRGVLRLMAAVIHSLWEKQDSSLLIMPANVPMDDLRVRFELTRYLEEQWDPVIEKDVDGPHSLPLSLDRENPNLGRYSACRRVARTIYMGSAPMQGAAHRGLDDRQVKLGCVQPGESVATFGDALRRLTDQATYLFVDGKRYWYSTQQSVTKLAEDRANQLHENDILDEIKRRVRNQSRMRGDFVKVHACASSGDIPDEREALLAILGPEFTHSHKEKDSPAIRECANILDMRGNSPRNFKNTLVFLAPDANRLQDLEQAVAQFLAWKSIWNERVALNLDPFQAQQAETKRENAEQTVDARIPEAYQWLIVPSQNDPKGGIEWGVIRQQGQDALAVRASKKLKNEEMLLIQLGGVRLRHDLDRIPLWRGNHVGIRQLIDDFATYVYLPRVRDESVLLEAVRGGLASITWNPETFAYAEDFDEEKGRYKGLVSGRNVNVIADGGSVLVKPEAAGRQMKEDRAKQTEAEAAAAGTTSPQVSGIGEPGVRDATPPPAPKPRRFHGSVKLDPLRIGHNAARIGEEVVQHLTSIMGAEVEVTLEIQANIPDGAPDKTVRDVTENCQTLKFETHGFEEE